MTSSRDDIGLTGAWRVARVGGWLPPLIGVDKRIAGGRGVTRVAGAGVAAFRVEHGEEGPRLVYRPPFRGVVDQLRADGAGGWHGTCLVLGREVGRFRMWREGEAPPG